MRSIAATTADVSIPSVRCSSTAAVAPSVAPSVPPAVAPNAASPPPSLRAVPVDTDVAEEAEAEAAAVAPVPPTPLLPLPQPTPLPVTLLLEAPSQAAAVSSTAAPLPFAAAHRARRTHVVSLSSGGTYMPPNTCPFQSRTLPSASQAGCTPGEVPRRCSRPAIAVIADACLRM